MADSIKRIRTKGTTSTESSPVAGQARLDKFVHVSRPPSDSSRQNHLIDFLHLLPQPLEALRHHTLFLNECGLRRRPELVIGTTPRFPRHKSFTNGFA